jgi:hypothetical protein
MEMRNDAMSNENESPEKGAGRRRGFLKTLGFGAAAAATPALAQHAVSPRADAVPARDARKENGQQRLAARFRPDTPEVIAFNRTNRYEH